MKKKIDIHIIVIAMLLILLTISGMLFARGVSRELWTNSIQIIKENTRQGANTVNIQIAKDFAELGRIKEVIAAADPDRLMDAAALCMIVEPDVMVYVPDSNLYDSTGRPGEAGQETSVAGQPGEAGQEMSVAGQSGEAGQEMSGAVRPGEAGQKTSIIGQDESDAGQQPEGALKILYDFSILCDVMQLDEMTRSFLDETDLERGIIDSHVSSVNGENVFHIFERVPLAGIGMGYLVKEYRAKEIAEQFTLTFYDYTGFSYLVNQTGKIMVRSRHKNSNKTISNLYEIIPEEEHDSDKLSLLKDSIYELRSGWAEFTDGEDGLIFCYEPLRSESNWLLVSVVPECVIAEQAKSILQKIMMFAVMVVIIILLIAAAFYGIKMRENKAHTIQLCEALDAADAANEVKGQFLMNMSHDIRTPLNAIIGMTVIARDSMGNKEKMRESLEKINQSGKHLLSLVNDVLDMSQISDGKMILREDDFNFARLYEEVSDLMGAMAKEAGIVMETVPVHLKNEMVSADAHRIRQVFMNIITNAIKYTHSGGHVTIELTQMSDIEDENAVYRFCCTDTGIGMEKDFLEKVFQAFVRHQNTTASGIAGIGVGLAITKGLLDLMGGSISIESEPGKGSVFTVNLPLRICENVPQAEWNAAHSKNNVVKAKNNALQVRNNALQAEQNESQAKSNAVQADKNEPQVENNALQAEQNESQTENNALQAENNVLQAENNTLQAEQNKLQAEQNESQAENNALQTEQNESQAENNTLQAEQNESQTENNALQAKNNMPQAENDALHTDQSVPQTEPDDSDEAEQKDRTGYGYVDKRILIVEDVELNMEIAEAMLSTTGVQIEKAYNGQEAVQKVRENPCGYYDLIFMDIQMPVMDGYEATRQIRGMDRQDAAEIPIFALSANALAQDVQNSKNAGMNGHLAKPIDMDPIEKVMRRYLA